MSGNITERYRPLKEFLVTEINSMWHYDEIEEFRYYRAFDYEDWYYYYNIELVMTNGQDGTSLLVIMEHVSGNFSFDGGIQITGLSIEDVTEAGYEREIKYHVFDFESNDINVYCKEITVQHVEKV